MAESQSQQTIAVHVLGELLADLLGCFNGLVVCRDTSDANGILVDIAAGSAAVTVRYLPTGTFHFCPVFTGLVDAVFSPLRRRQLA